MNVKEYDLKINSFVVNPDYIDKHKTLSVHEFEINEDINYINLSKRQLTLYIKVIIDSKTDNVNIVKAEFSRYFEIELHSDEKHETYFNGFIWHIIDTFSSVRNYLLDNIPVEIIEITPPLIDGYEQEKVALSIYEKLKKQSF